MTGLAGLFQQLPGQGLPLLNEGRAPCGKRIRRLAQQPLQRAAAGRRQQRGHIQAGAGQVLAVLQGAALLQKLRRCFPGREIVCCTDTENKASIALLLKLGFAEEGYEKEIDSLVFCLS